jgi:hypothetical protein
MPELKDTNELLKKLGFPTIEEIQPDASEQPALRRNLEKAIQLILDADSDKEEGGYRIRVQDRHIALSRSAWPLIELGAKIVLESHLPHGGIMAAQSVLEFFSKMRDLVTKLDPTERLIYEAVAGVSESKRLLAKSDKGASVEDLRERFRQEDQVVPVTLEEDLKGMAENPEKRVLSRHNYQDRGPYYQVVF